MRVETWLWTGVMVFYLVIGALYTAISDDPVGSSILLIASGFGGLMRSARSACIRRRACDRSPWRSA